MILNPLNHDFPCGSFPWPVKNTISVVDVPADPLPRWSQGIQGRIQGGLAGIMIYPWSG